MAEATPDVRWRVRCDKDHADSFNPVGQYRAERYALRSDNELDCGPHVVERSDDGGKTWEAI